MTTRTCWPGFGIGGAVGSLVMASVRMPRRYLTLMNLGWGAACLPFLVIGVTTQIWVVVACAFVMGAVFSGPMVIWGTLLQRRVPPALLGRVASLDFFVSVSLMPVSMALAGPVADLIGLQATFAVAGIVPIVVAVVATLWARLPQDELAHPLDDDARARGRRRRPALGSWRAHDSPRPAAPGCCAAPPPPAPLAHRQARALPRRLHRAPGARLRPASPTAAPTRARSCGPGCPSRRTTARARTARCCSSGATGAGCWPCS